MKPESLRNSHWRHAPNAIFWVAVAIAIIGVILPFFWTV